MLLPCFPPRFFTMKKRIYLLLFTVITFVSFVISSNKSQIARELKLEKQLAKLHIKLDFMTAKYRAKAEEYNNLQKILVKSSIHKETSHTEGLPDDVMALLNNITGMRAHSGALSYNIRPLKSYFSYLLMPHLLDHADSLKPAYHMSGSRSSVDIVIGVPTVKRDKDSYLMQTLQHLIKKLNKRYCNSTLIVVMVGETDLKYVINIAKNLETTFPKEVEDGLIEVMSASKYYYPDLDAIKPTLGDSLKRAKWRTKQNLDAIYLMAYAQTKGPTYLMLEDDVQAKPDYMKHIKNFISTTSVANPDWMVIEFCNIGGIGKMFRTTSLIQFIQYVQLFYSNMPLDWLIESFLYDKVCPLEKRTKECNEQKLKVRPRYNSTLFTHIGVYSSLKGKIHRAKKTSTITSLYFPHDNPHYYNLITSLDEYRVFTLKAVYEGATYMWARYPKVGDTIEIIFLNPITLSRYLFRSANVEHVKDKFYETDVQVLPVNSSGKAEYVTVGEFDEFGLAEGEISKFLGPVLAMRLYVRKDSKFWVILSEIHIQTSEKQNPIPS